MSVKSTKEPMVFGVMIGQIQALRQSGALYKNCARKIFVKLVSCGAPPLVGAPIWIIRPWADP